MLVVEGAAGIGKSRLLGELRAKAGPRQRVLSARASELERDPAAQHLYPRSRVRQRNAELFVTPKTVEVHLSATYRKLGISGRRDLQRALQTP